LKEAVPAAPPKRGGGQVLFFQALGWASLSGSGRRSVFSGKNAMPDLHQHPFSIQFFVPTGDPDALRIVEKSNWSGVGVVFNRTNYKEAVKRSEFHKIGVYVLIDTSEGSVSPTIYIGEGDSVKDRLDQHYGKIDFWNWAVFFVAKDKSLNKAHVQHLEARLYALAKRAKRCKIENKQEPLPPTLSESETAFAETFLQDILSIFPLLGLHVFEKSETVKPPEDLLTIESKGINASGYENAEGFVVTKGSQLVRDETKKILPSLSALRKGLLTQGVTVDDGTWYVFTQNHVFTSPSTAAGVVLARSADGRKEWKNKDGKTLKQIQEALTEAEAEKEERAKKKATTKQLANEQPSDSQEFEDITLSAEQEEWLAAAEERRAQGRHSSSEQPEQQQRAGSA
jgi:Domain of unknown function (DUF4357)